MNANRVLCSWLDFSENGNGLCDVLGPVFVDKCLCNAALPWISSAHFSATSPAQTREGVKPIITLSAEERKTSYILSQCHCSAEVITCITRYYTIIIPSLLGITPFYLRINPS
uniref:Uncharacterized protein n=1 Tax=Rousettus aegyptiacus TaxID=9407 RepID=A0A7J8HPQ0_ROUAE|nr:hypothetical protein HJG63_004849 [Rousettus aegyptiacus]